MIHIETLLYEYCELCMEFVEANTPEERLLHLTSLSHPIRCQAGRAATKFGDEEARWRMPAQWRSTQKHLD